jgi:hypothetical protein
VRDERRTDLDHGRGGWGAQQIQTSNFPERYTDASHGVKTEAELTKDSVASDAMPVDDGLGNNEGGEEEKAMEE